MIEVLQEMDEGDITVGAVTGTSLGAPSQFHFGIPKKRMDVIGSIPGYHLCWVYEDEAHIAQMDGYQFVAKGEVKTPVNVVPRDSGLGEYISTVVNKPQFDGGIQIRQFLMKVKQESYDAATEQLDAPARAVEQSILQGMQGKGHYVRPDLRPSIRTSTKF